MTLEAAVRRQAILAERRNGRPVRQIAALLGISRNRVYQLIQREERGPRRGPRPAAPSVTLKAPAPSTTPPAVYAGLPTPAAGRLCGACTVIRRADLVDAEGRAFCMSCWCERELRRPS